MQKIKIPTLIAVIVLTLGLALGAVLIQSQKIFRLGADETIAPQNVRITNLSSTSFSVSWTTQKEIESFIVWGNSQNSQENIESDEISTRGYLHHTSVSGLTNGSTYYFKINSGGVEYDNNGIPWVVKIPQSIAPLNIKPITGTVLTSTGTPATKVLVYLNIGGASPLSTTTSENGSFVFPLNNLLTSNLDSVFVINETSDIIELTVQAGPLGISSAQIFASSGRPTPPLLLGQNHDFKNLPPSSNEILAPTADINTPEIFEKSSKFDVSSSQTSSTSQTSITSIDEGETITTQKPQFFGKGPSGENIIITVESENAINGNTTVSSNGNWSWSPPTSLVPGDHTITLSYRDQKGILRKIVKNFTIEAAEKPAFVATPSATPTLKPNLTPTPKASSTATPHSTMTATPVPQPDSGIPLPTLFMLIFGVSIFTIGVFISAKSIE